MFTELDEQPLVQGFRQTLRSNPDDPSCVLVLVDWLQEQGVSLSDLLWLYAGPFTAERQQAHVSLSFAEDEGLREAIALWCQREEPTRANEPCHPFGHPEEACSLRFEAVRACLIPAENYLTRRVGECSIDYLHRYPEAVVALRRAHKRRLLNLFPEVEHTSRVVLPQKDVMHWLTMSPLGSFPGVQAALAEAGIRHNRTMRTENVAEGILVEQTLAAPEWIAPESHDGMPAPHRAMSQDAIAGEELHNRQLVRSDEQGRMVRARRGEDIGGIVLDCGGDLVTGRRHAIAGEVVRVRLL